MALVKFIQTTDNMLSTIPVKEGQLIFCTDSQTIYVDQSVDSVAQRIKYGSDSDNFVEKTGDTMTGSLTIKDGPGTLKLSDVDVSSTSAPFEIKSYSGQYIVVTFSGDGQTRVFDLPMEADLSEGCNVNVNSEPLSPEDYNFSRMRLQFDDLHIPEDGAYIEIGYTVASNGTVGPFSESNQSAYTFGTRSDGEKVGAGSFVSGIQAAASGKVSHAEGINTSASGDCSHAEGEQSVASGASSHSEGINTHASGVFSHAEGAYTSSNGTSSHAEGRNTEASGDYSHAEGVDTIASGINSHAEGDDTHASGPTSHAEGYETDASGATSHAEGYSTTASGELSHAEGGRTTASGYASHSEGIGTHASGSGSHAEGSGSYAIGNFSHAEGLQTAASGLYSHAQNKSTIAASEAQTALGKYNVQDIIDTYAVIIGNGTDPNNRSNALTVDWDGNVEANNLATREPSSTSAAVIDCFPEGTPPQRVRIKVADSEGHTYYAILLDDRIALYNANSTPPGDEWRLYTKPQQLTITRIENEVMNVAAVNNLRAYEISGMLWFNGYVQITSPLMISQALEISVAQISGWNAVDGCYGNIAMQDGQGHMLVYVTKTGQVRVYNNSGVNVGGYGRITLCAPKAY